MNILCSSDSPYIPSGFAKQMDGIARFLSEFKKNNVSYMAWQTNHSYSPKEFPYYIHGVNTQFGLGDYQHIFQKSTPDIVLTLGDAYMVSSLGDIPRPFWIGYYPLDGHPVPSNIASIISKMDIPVAMSYYGKKLTENYVGITPEFIPHFFKPENFHELSRDDINKFKKQMGIPEDSFIIGSLARLNPRKHHYRLLRAFKKFLDSLSSEEASKVFLYLHLDPRDVIMFPNKNYDYQFLEQIDIEELGNNVIITPNHKFVEGVSTDVLNNIINIFDVHVLSTGGEGFGVPIIETMACGIPQILTDYTTSRELLTFKTPYSEEPTDKERGILVKPSRLYLEYSNVYKAWVDINELAVAMKAYYDNRDVMKEHGQNAKEYVHKYFTYDTVMKKWRDLLDRVYPNMYVTVSKEVLQ